MAGDLSSPLEGITSTEKTPPIKLAIAVTFHYVEKRLDCLAALSSRFGSLAKEIVVTIVTNTGSGDDHRKITDVFRKDGIDVSIFTPTGLGHPYLLTWSHFVVMRRQFADKSVTHFLYLEDDLLYTQEHINYLLEAREMLRPVGLIPALFRVEQNPNDREWYSTDQRKRIEIGATPRVALPVDNGLGFINPPMPYQASYFLDRELMAEHLDGLSSNPDFGVWPIRERAAQGLAYVKVPEGFTSRLMVPYYENEKRIAQCCLLHHMTNSYVLHSKTVLGKIKVREIFL